MEAPDSFQGFISEQLSATRSRIIAEYERRHGGGGARESPLGGGAAAISLLAAEARASARAPAADQAGIRYDSTISPMSTPSAASYGPRVEEAVMELPAAAGAESPRSLQPASPKRHQQVQHVSEASSATQMPTPRRTSKSSTLSDGSAPLRRSSKSSTTTWENDEGTSVLDPRAAWYRTWQNAIALVVVFSVFFTPMRYAFQDRSSWATRADYCIDAIFGADMLLTFNVATVENNGYVWDRWLIFKSYVTSLRFWVDLIAVLPSSELAAFCGAGPAVSDTLNLLRLLRANRILILFRDLQKNIYLNLMGVVVAKFVLFIVLCTHTAGCIFYALASYKGFDEDTWVARVDPELPSKPWYLAYVYMLYWAVGTYKAGPAHGPIFPASEYEMLLSCFAMMVNIILQTYLVSSMAALLTTADVRIYAMRNRLKQLAEFSQRYGLTPAMFEEIQSYIRFKFSTNQELDQNLLGGLPEIYRQRISHALHDGLLANLLMFNACGNIFLKQLHGALESVLQMEGHDLVHVDDPATELHILADGEVAVYYEEHYVESRFGGEGLSAVPFVCQVAHPFTLRTRKHCRILTLNRNAWDATSNSFPEDIGHVKSNLLVECSERRASFGAGSPGALAYDALIQTLEAHTAMQRESAISSLCYAAASGDTAKIRRILRAHTADCADYDMRAPLHIAAAKGQMAALELLTSRNANVNIMDNFGRTPLMEALRSRQDAAAQFLFDHGGSLGFSSQQGSGQSDEAPAETHNLHAQASELCEAASDTQLLWYLSALVRYGADVNASDYDARTPLHVASAVGNKPMVELLLTCEDIDNSPVDRFGRTPLMEAVRHGHEPCARLLRAHGASHGFTENGKLSSDANAVHAGQELCQAAFTNQTVYLHSLITHCGISVDSADYDLRTALMLACAEGNTDAAVTLVQLGADVHRKDRWGHTALTEAREHGHTDLERVLKQLGAVARRPGAGRAQSPAEFAYVPRRTVAAKTVRC